jgi:hypothetical protein
MAKRILAAGLVTLALLVVGAGTASAEPPMTHNFAPTCDMTHNRCSDMTHN